MLPSLCRYVMIAGDSSLVVDAKHRKAAYPISVKDTMLRIFQMRGSLSRESLRSAFGVLGTMGYLNPIH